MDQRRLRHSGDSQSHLREARHCLLKNYFERSALAPQQALTSVGRKWGQLKPWKAEFEMAIIVGMTTQPVSVPSDKPLPPLMITEEMAVRFLRNPTSTFFDAAESIDLNAARRLSQFSGELHLDGLASLSPEEAEALSGFSGKELSLNGLREISDPVIRILARTRCDWLTLDGPAEISCAAAVALSTFKGKVLSLEGISVLSESAAKALAGFKGGYLHLFGLRKLESHVAMALLGYRGLLCLDALLNSEAVDILSRAKGGTHYSCSKVVELDVAMAKTLSKQNRASFKRLKCLSIEAARELFGFPTIEEFVFKSLECLTPEVANEIGKSRARYGTLGGFRTISDYEVGALTAYRRNICNIVASIHKGCSLPGDAIQGVPSSIMSALVELVPCITGQLDALEKEGREPTMVSLKGIKAFCDIFEDSFLQAERVFPDVTDISDAAIKQLSDAGFRIQLPAVPRLTSNFASPESNTAEEGC